MTETPEIIRIAAPIPPPRQLPVSVDHGMQTVILPRRTIFEASLPSYQSNPEATNGDLRNHEYEYYSEHRNGQDVSVAGRVRSAGPSQNVQTCLHGVQLRTAEHPSRIRLGIDTFFRQ